MNAFGTGIFGGNNQSTMDQMRQQIEMQMQHYNKMQNASQQQQGSNGFLEDFKNTISSLSQDEQQYLIKTNEFIHAKSVYEQGFIDFLGGKFADEYLNTPIGKQAIENLLETTKKSVKLIKDATKERNNRLEALAKLAEEDPEIQRRLQEKLNS